MLREQCKKCKWYAYRLGVEVCTNSNWMPDGYFDVSDVEDKKCVSFTPSVSFIKYKHHSDDEVWVREDLKGRHREFCLCHKCKKLNVNDRDKNCPIANQLFNICLVNDLVTPVWECPQFENKE
jgi:hypothetical protein